MLLVNARHIKQVPGRKTDVKDSEWIAELLQHGLLRGSYIPPAPQRELRELTRQRTQLMRQKATVSNRIQKVLEDANIKLASVATDVLEQFPTAAHLSSWVGMSPGNNESAGKRKSGRTSAIVALVNGVIEQAVGNRSR